MAPPYLILKKKFGDAGFVIKDQSGFWGIQIVFRSDEVHVLHEKKSVSGSEFLEEQFEFMWNLQIVLDKQVTLIKNVKLTLTDFEINAKVPE